MTCIPIKDGIICLAKTDFNCPACGYEYTDNKYSERIQKSKRGYIYLNCEKCGTRIGISANYKSEIDSWCKSDERKYNRIIKP